ncbi:MAG: metal-dependent hydrolase [Planctomycetes bacterium]|nr:metal-dependent hydrolase [Planctomycetota bacterium]
MSVKLTWLGHSAFLIEAGPHRVAIDPFLSGNPSAPCKPADLNPTHIVMTHGHEDHFSDTIDIAKRTGATVYGVYELMGYCSAHGVKHTEPMNPGGKVAAPFGFVALTQAFHSSSFNGVYTGMPAGTVVNVAGKTFYHTGDTALFSDMKLIGEIYKPQVAMICAGDRFTMGPELAARAAEFIQPRVAIPCHWGTWPPLADEAKIRAGFTPAGVEAKIMKPGESMMVG